MKYSYNNNHINCMSKIDDCLSAISFYRLSVIPIFETNF